MVENPYEPPAPAAEPPPPQDENAGVWHWLQFAAGGAVFGWVFLSRHLRGPGDPTGHIIGPAAGAFLGLIVAVGCRIGLIKK